MKARLSVVSASAVSIDLLVLAVSGKALLSAAQLHSVLSAVLAVTSTHASGDNIAPVPLPLTPKSWNLWVILGVALAPPWWWDTTPT